MKVEPAEAALWAVNHVPGMVAYWDAKQKCVFSNNAYREWFGKTPEQMVGMSMEELLGPLYEKNLPHIRAALLGEKQVFERQIPLPGGEIRDSIATYTPDILDGCVRGFSVQVTDVTILRQREAALERTVRQLDKALADVNTLRGLLPICAGCKKIRDLNGEWQSIEKYVTERTDATFSHGLCPDCVTRLYPELGGA
jgi:PAS domain S-box-containing protein